jgi:hypothetical protein
LPCADDCALFRAFAVNDVVCLYFKIFMLACIFFDKQIFERLTIGRGRANQEVSFAVNAVV